ncbi:DHH family phosphoesterase [Bacillus cereus]|uniref:DHH family phosphoesterase n=1 Tax=Bacillus cereus TaxID=1396 RepID=UPI00211D9ED7|nr:phosphoesterase [Bacillus cereus]
MTIFTNLPSLTDKVVHHLSHNDMDGYAPQVVSKVSKLNTAEFIHCGYSNFEKKLEDLVTFFEEAKALDGHAILITDITPKSEELVDRLNNLFERGLAIVLLDHHEKANWISKKYPKWAFIESELNGQKTCGTELLYIYLKENELFSTDVAESPYFASFVEQVRAYDTWDWNTNGNVEAKELNSLLYTFGPSKFMHMQFAKIAEHMNDPEAVQYTFNETEKLFVDVENKKEAKYIESRSKTMAVRTWNVNGENMEVGVVFGDQYHSTLGNVLSQENPHLLFIAILDLNTGKASLRTIHDTIHLGDIAEAIAPGGGGHPKAAGFEFGTEIGLMKIEEAIGVSSAGVTTNSWKEQLLKVAN